MSDDSVPIVRAGLAVVVIILVMTSLIRRTVFREWWLP
jgi:hypothetical protein